jgi:hypothetical protein
MELCSGFGLIFFNPAVVTSTVATVPGIGYWAVTENKSSIDRNVISSKNESLDISRGAGPGHNTTAIDRPRWAVPYPTLDLQIESRLDISIPPLRSLSLNDRTFSENGS